MKYKIYQIKDTRNIFYSFVGWNSAVAQQFSLNDYHLVYEGEISGDYVLDKLFEKFNIDRPEDFHGHSLSVSDLVVLNKDGNDFWYYCDSFGWEDITEFVFNTIKE